MQAQSLAVKRAEVEFHRFAALGQPERALGEYANKNFHRAALIRKHMPFCGTLSPFLEIGANAGYTAAMLSNEFGAEGFALDISADALALGGIIDRAWGYERAPVRIAGDAARLPFRDGSLQFVMAWQMLSQFMDIERVIVEVKRVLAPGGVFLFGEEPLLRMLSLRLYRCSYPDLMKPWERKLYDWGLLGYVVRDVIGAQQEESFGIRQNHRMRLGDWHHLVTKHFAAHEYEMFVPERGWGERIVKRAAIRLDPCGSVWRAAKLLGGTMAAFCRKDGKSEPATGMASFEQYLACPDCGAALTRDDVLLACTACPFRSALEDGVYNLLSSGERAELYPGEREDILDISRPDHTRSLREGWHAVEGVYGNKYRWIGPRATALLKAVKSGPQRLRVRGHAAEAAFAAATPHIRVLVNSALAIEAALGRPGMFVLEADVPEAPDYEVTIEAAPVWHAPGDQRDLTVNLSLIRLVERNG
ncbi:MAG TPA: class I SAM-dependent methyltransferase [Bryobacteraceae bacterium]|nr:class I SAM-dependent methyltransferase [Bryobacteraceae bacterium]